MVGNAGYLGRDDNGAGLFVVQGDGLLVLEGGCDPVVHEDIELCLGLARSLEDLLDGEAVVLVEVDAFGQVGSSVKPFVAIAFLGIPLKVLGFHHLCRSAYRAAKQDYGNERPQEITLHLSIHS